ncbi:hypothetical protein KC967_02400 [Candidatus Saccharibacteria bacterium]|nr:hypothetical protein [Candidatus Saccharibacteria bacterium]
MESELIWKNVTTAVRTPRFAVLVDNNPQSWKAYVNGAIQSFSQTWGGEHFLIIPTDGTSIDEVFWRILEAYSPDYIGRYIPNLADMADFNPQQFDAVKQHNRQGWQIEDEDEFEKHWREAVKSTNIGGLDVDAALSEELKNRLSPFYFQDHIVSENVFRNSTIGYPFTHLEHIVAEAKDRPTEVVKPLEIDDAAYKLLALSKAGALSPEYASSLDDKGVAVKELPAFTERFRLKDYIVALDTDEYEPYWLDEPEESSNFPEKNFISKLPFALSMLALGKYYRHATHRDWEEGKVVVVGDTVDDYCLYYCLSRLHQDVHWLPDEHLYGAHRKDALNSSRSDDEEVVPFDENEGIAAGLVNEYFKGIGYGHNKKRIQITSHSLTMRQLGYRKRWMARICFMNDIERHCDVVPAGKVSLECVVQIIELNNHTNQQDMVFQNGKSVGRLNTPKPKNFNNINPAEHRWITSVAIDGFRPPALPYLGTQVIKLNTTTHDTRSGKDELAYFCPNVGYFGGDIDVNVVRPYVELLSNEAMFSDYFANSGYSTQLSDKGSYLKDTVSRFGSLEQTAAFFRAEKNRNLFDQYLTATQNRSDDEVIYLDTEKRAHISFEAFKRKLGAEEEAVRLIDELIAKEIISRGLIFQCSRCRRAGWYSIASVSDRFTCLRCGLEQPYNHASWKSPAEPKWYYRLAETVYLFYGSSSHLTVLALDKLRQEAPNEFHYVSETDITNPELSRPKQEVDVLAIVRGRMVLGECKDCPVKASDLRKYHTIFSQLNIKPAYFLLATTEVGVSDTVQDELGKFTNHRLFTRGDLYE